MSFSMNAIEEIDLYRMYRIETISQQKIADYYGVSRQVIVNRLEEYDIEKRNRGEAKRIYNINENFFEKWTQENTWLFGWIVGDGCITNPKCIAFNLARVDREVLDKFKNVLNSEHPIKDYERENKRYQNNFKYSNIRFHSKKLVKDAKELSLYDIPENLFSHFLRGFFEAEGCVFWHKKERLRKGGIIGSGISQNDEKMLKFICWKLRTLGITKGGGLHSNKKNWTLEFSVKDTISIYHYIYNDKGNMFLKRKKKLFDKLIEKQMTAISKK